MRQCHLFGEIVVEETRRKSKTILVVTIRFGKTEAEGRMMSHFGEPEDEENKNCRFGIIFEETVVVEVLKCTGYVKPCAMRLSHFGETEAEEKSMNLFGEAVAEEKTIAEVILTSNMNHSGEVEEGVKQH
ncbi:unnamed protein product, partial [Iphiclides podalirius]